MGQKTFGAGTEFALIWGTVRLSEGGRADEASPTRSVEALAGHSAEQGWTHPDHLLMSAVFIATGREKKTLLGCNSPPQITHEVCPEVYFTGGGFPPASWSLSQQMRGSLAALLLAKGRRRRGLEEQGQGWGRVGDGDGK